MPATASYTKDVGSKDQLVFDRNFEFLHSRSIAGNFANLIAQNAPKSSKSSKSSKHGGRRDSQPKNEVQNVQADIPENVPSLLPELGRTESFQQWNVPQYGPPPEQYMTDVDPWRMHPIHGQAEGNGSNFLPNYDTPPEQYGNAGDSWRVQQIPRQAEGIRSNFRPQFELPRVQSRIDEDLWRAQHRRLGQAASAGSNLEPKIETEPDSAETNGNPWQVQWEGAKGVPETEVASMEDDYSENMELSSGPEADEIAADISPVRDVGDNHLLPQRLSPNAASHSISDFSDNMDLSSGPEAESEYEEESDDLSESQRLSTTPSKGTGRSSHTSTGLSNDVKIPMEKGTATHYISKLPSPSSDLSSQLSPAKSPTPAALSLPSDPPKMKRRRKMGRVKRIDFADQRPRTSIPVDLLPATVAQQGIHAAYASRLSPFALHPDEYQLLKSHICNLHVTAYLNIRNRILRLWVRNPLVSVTAEEAAGCALASRWLGLAEVAYEWLIRKGYINFGCLEIPEAQEMKVRNSKPKRAKNKTIIVIGAGVAGLGCARQLEGLVRHYSERWSNNGEEPPNIILLEGRNRIGGRVYSHQLKDQRSSGIPEGKRCTAEMGAHIIIGFDHGNPLSMIVRGQLALHYHTLKDNSILHDVDGSLVDQGEDERCELLYNDVLDRASVYRDRVPGKPTAEGDHQLIEAGRDPQREGGASLSVLEAETTDPPQNDDVEVENVPGGIDKLTGKAHMVSGRRKKDPPAVSAKAMGWKLPSNVLTYREMNLDVVVKGSQHPTLGAAMDEAVKQYHFLLDLSPLHMRLLNWHYANLEYANAANVGKLSLGSWDQDAGNEFEGYHAQVVGGYQQVPRAILNSPSKLDLRTRKIVKRITYNIWSGNSKTAGAKVTCEDGETIEADHVVLTTPLGVLKNDAIAFDPPLPDWKTEPINRLGFGTLNKVILVYEKPFWDVNQNMFGLLRKPEVEDSLDQEDYVANRGRFYFFWNCIKTSGRPVLISLMAGDAAHQAEAATDEELVLEVTQELTKIFKNTAVPMPSETIVTRWRQDKFARGSYSFVGAEAKPGDYERMALPVGNLHFAGEATCATHPATVHGAYISGLRAASEVIDDLLGGPIEVPTPLVLWPTSTETHTHPIPPKRPKPSLQSSNIKSNTKIAEPLDVKQARLEAFESDILQAIYSELGLRPSPPTNPRSNPYLLYTTEHWQEVKAALDAARLAATGSTNTKGSGAKNEIRSRLAAMWKAAPEEVKRPYIKRTTSNKLANQESAKTFDERLAAWDVRAMEVRRKYVGEHPGVLTSAEEHEMWRALGVYGDFVSEERKAKRASGYADEKGE